MFKIWKSSFHSRDFDNNTEFHKNIWPLLRTKKISFRNPHFVQIPLEVNFRLYLKCVDEIELLSCLNKDERGGELKLRNDSGKFVIINKVDYSDTIMNRFT